MVLSQPNVKPKLVRGSSKMAKKKKSQQPFDSEGGVTVIQRRLLDSDNYLTLSPHAKALIPLLQTHWKPDKYVDYGVREAQKKIPCARKTAMKSFDELQERGFITCMELAFFSSRTECKSRAWRLEWLPYNYQEPLNTWEDWTPN